MIQKKIFCTEPFRIPFGGKIDICCFDKTGTLTQTDLIIKGLLMPDNKFIGADSVANAEKNAKMVIGGCHTLSLTDGNLMGDPLEK